jgi:hypothetical protein
MKYVILTLTLALALTGWGLWAQVHTNAELSAKLEGTEETLSRLSEQREQDRKVLVARAQKIASKQRELARAQEALAKALQANNDWSNTNVPTDVQKALTGPSGASN